MKHLKQSIETFALAAILTVSGCASNSIKTPDKVGEPGDHSSSSVTPESSSSETSEFTGSMTDPRDGQTYRTVKIGNQVWMAENLKVKTENSWCYACEESICKEYGRLYTWEMAKTSCPAGWHLPSKNEFETLFEAVGGESIAGKELKSADDWNIGNGTDAYAFSVLAAGIRDFHGSYIDGGYSALFWSSSEYSSGFAYYVFFGFKYDSVSLRDGHKRYGFSVRCLKD